MSLLHSQLSADFSDESSGAAAVAEVHSDVSGEPAVVSQVNKYPHTYTI